MNSRELNSNLSLFALPDIYCLETDWNALMGAFSFFKEKDHLSLYKRLLKIKKINVFKQFSDAKLISILQAMKKKVFKEKQVIFSENDPADSFFMLHKGRVQIIKRNKVVRELTEGSSFGEIALISSMNRTAGVITLTETKCFVLKKNVFLKLLDGENMDILRHRMHLLDQSVKLEDLYFTRFLGRGKYGVCNLVHNKKGFYAIKSVPQGAVESQKSLCTYFKTERQILLSLDHVFIVKLVKTLKDSDFIYFLMEHINGCCFDKVIDNSVFKQPNSLRFYLGCLIIAIDYLNKLYISHRDVKPANIMIAQTVSP